MSDVVVTPYVTPRPLEFSAINGDSVTLVPGMPIATGPVAGQVRRGNAASQARSSILGLVTVGAAPTLRVHAQPDGAIQLTTEQWDAVTGNVGGLVPRAHGRTTVQAA